MSAICELAGIGKSFGRTSVLDGFTMTAEQGEMIAITGRSGSGKSTLLNIIGVLESPDRGALKLFGTAAPKPGGRRAAKLLRHRLAYLFQNYALIDNESVDYNLRIAQKYAQGSGATKGAARADVLEKVGLAGFGKRKVYELSGGEQQRVAIARILLKPCDLVLADEPTGSLDPANRDAVLGLLRQINESGKTVLIVTHDDQVSAACTRAIALGAATVHAEPPA